MIVLPLSTLVPLRAAIVRAALIVLVAASAASAATTRYVWQGSASAAPPYSTWDTAATNIQDAVDVAVDGDTVLVTNGVYDTGGALTPGYTLSNRVCVTNAIIVQSVNGPVGTIIVGQGPLGSNAVRGVFLQNGATLAGITLSNGYTMDTGSFAMQRGGGGALLAVDCVITNCVVTTCAAHWGGGGGVRCDAGGTVRESALIKNDAMGGYGGGVCCSSGGLVTNCLLAGNTSPGASGGGGACDGGGAFVSCILTNNWGSNRGGGVIVAMDGRVEDCLVIKNTASAGGGVSLFLSLGRIINCLVVSNWAASSRGGGVEMYGGGLMENCTLVDNTSPLGGGIFADGAGTQTNSVLNSIIYNNNGGDWATNDSLSFMTHSCTTPDFPGEGNSNADPLFVAPASGDFTLQLGSPCRNTGTTNAPWEPTTIDFAGNPRVIGNMIDMGCYETVVPQPFIDITTPGTSLAYTVTLFAVSGTNNAAVVGMMDVWNASYGSGTQSFGASLSWTTPFVPLGYGSNLLVVAGTNAWGDRTGDDVWIIAGCGLTNYVSSDGFAIWPYTNWITAAKTIQGAVDAAVDGNVVMVSNGVYASGTRGFPGFLLSNRVQNTKPIAIQSLNGPQFTCIEGSYDPATGGNGSNAVRCVAMLAGSLQGFTISNGATCTEGDWMVDVGGGGLYASFSRPVRVKDCIFVANRAARAGGGITAFATDAIFENCQITGNEASFAGGADHGTFFDCLFTGNTATGSNLFGGGAVWVARLVNCTIARNTSLTEMGGGGVGCKEGEPAFLTNCIVWGNSAPSNTLADNYATGGFRAVHTCTDPMPLDGYGNIATNPLFVSMASNNFRIEAESLCREAGTNQDWMLTAVDLDGTERILPAGSVVDMGAYEFVPEPSTALVVVGCWLFATRRCSRSS